MPCGIVNADYPKARPNSADIFRHTTAPPSMSRSDQASQGHDFQIATLIELLEQQDEEMEDLFVKAINLYAAPNAGGLSEREKLDHLRLAVEKSLGGASA